MAAFSTPFWSTVAGVAVLAAGVSYMVRPQEGQRLNNSAGMLSELGESRVMARDSRAPRTGDEPAPAAETQHAPHREASAFTIDALGRLVVAAKTLPVLDSWLLLAGPTQNMALIETPLRAALPSLAAQRAWSLLRAHAAYRQAERELLAQLKTQAPLSARELLDKTMALRRRHYDSVSVQELFGLQEARGLYGSEVARILADTGLSEAQQTQRLMALRMSLPPEVAAQEFGGAEFSLALEKHVAEMRANGENDAEVTYLRKQFVDSEGARSVLEVENEQLQMQKQAWELRHPTYVRQRNQLIAADIEPEDKQRQLATLLRQHFRPDEMAAARAHSGL